MTNAAGILITAVIISRPFDVSPSIREREKRTALPDTTEQYIAFKL